MQRPNAPTPVGGLRILGFCDHFAADSIGGVERVTLEVYRRLVDAGAEIRVVSAVPGATNGDATIEGVLTRVVRAASLARVLRSQVTVAPGLRRVGRQEIATFGPQVIHASGLHFAGTRAAVGLARAGSVPLVTTTHLGSISALPLAARMPTRLYERTVGRRVIRSSTSVIAVSKAAAVHAVHLGASRVEIVPNGVDSHRFSPGERATDRFEVVFVGRLIANKGADVALRAFAAATLPEGRLTFVGDGPQRTRLERKAAALGARSVRFVGPAEDVAPFLTTAHVLVRPSLTEGRSLAILEAMASGACVVASDIDANRELIEDGTSGLLHRVGDHAHLADILRRLSSDRPAMQRLATAARAATRSQNWESTAAATGRILADAAESGVSR